MTFGELIDGLGKSLGIELTDEGGATAVEIDGVTVILHAAGDDLLLIHADLGEIAPENRDRVLAAAMGANFLYQGTGGSTLAVDPQSGRLHIQKYNWLERLDSEKAVTNLTRFADTVKAWRGIVSETAADISSADISSSLADMPSGMYGGFMQV